MVNANKDVLIAVHAYAGDKKQVEELMPVYEHHRKPIVIVTPDDSPITKMGPHICITAGKRAYIGQLSWDRQHLQLKKLLQYNHEWFLLHDSDSFIMDPELPDYLFEDKDVVWSNEVDDFRKPGESWDGLPPCPKDYHEGYDLIAMQPPYFLHRSALERIVKASEGMIACPICPFIDWWWVPACKKAGLTHKRFHNCASCETVTELGKNVMKECIQKRGARVIHSVKSGKVMRHLMNLKK